MGEENFIKEQKKKLCRGYIVSYIIIISLQQDMKNNDLTFLGVTHFLFLLINILYEDK